MFNGVGVIWGCKCLMRGLCRDVVCLMGVGLVWGCCVFNG